MFPNLSRLGRRISAGRLGNTARSAVRTFGPEIQRVRGAATNAQTGATSVGSAVSSLGEFMGRRRWLMGAGVGVAAVSGFGSGFSSQQPDMAGDFYEMTTGNRDIDEEVFGTEMGPLGLVAPLPRLPRVPTVPATFIGGGVGTVAGGLGGFALGSAVLRARGRGRIAATLAGAAVGGMGAMAGGAVGAGAGLAGSLNEQERRLVFNPTMISRSITDQRTKNTAARNAARYGNPMPNVDGSMVFGQYNFRGGN
jgi:hypothetical protein